MALDQDGLTLCDSSQLHNNTAVHTRQQSSSAPYLSVVVAEDSSPPPPPPPLVLTQGNSGRADWNGEALIEWTPSVMPFAYGRTFGYLLRGMYISYKSFSYPCLWAN